MARNRCTHSYDFKFRWAPQLTVSVTFILHAAVSLAGYMARRGVRIQPDGLLYILPCSKRWSACCVRNRLPPSKQMERLEKRRWCRLYGQWMAKAFVDLAERYGSRREHCLFSRAREEDEKKIPARKTEGFSSFSLFCCVVFGPKWLWPASIPYMYHIIS